MSAIDAGVPPPTPHLDQRPHDGANHVAQEPVAADFIGQQVRVAASGRMHRVPDGGASSRIPDALIVRTEPAVSLPSALERREVVRAFEQPRPRTASAACRAAVARATRTRARMG